MTIQKNVSLKKYNTFGIDVRANLFIIIYTKEDLINVLPELKKQPFLFLGGGSNVLFTKDFEGLVVVNQIKGKKIESIENQIIVSGFSGENWHEFVLWTIKNNAFGLENLSLIPGSTIYDVGIIGEISIDLKDFLTKRHPT